jgi:hypothetical protein
MPDPGQPPGPVTPSESSRWTGGRIAAIVGGSLLALQPSERWVVCSHSPYAPQAIKPSA